MAKADHNNFLVYKDWAYFVDSLCDETAGKLFKALFSFVNEGELTDFDDPMVVPIYNFMIKHITENEVKYQEKCKKNAENGAKGGRPPNKPNETERLNENQTVTDGCEKTEPNRTKAKKADNGNVNVTDNGNVNDTVNVNDTDNVYDTENENVYGNDNGEGNEKGFGGKQGETQMQKLTPEQEAFLADRARLQREKKIKTYDDLGYEDSGFNDYDPF